MKKRISILALAVAVTVTSCTSVNNGPSSLPSDSAVAAAPAVPAGAGDTADSGGTAEVTSEVTSEVTAETAVVTATLAPAAEQSGSALSGYDKISNEILVFERNGHLQALSAVWGLDSNMENYAKTVDEYAERLPGVNVYSMVIPTGAEFLLPDNHKGFSGSQAAKEAIVENTLTKAKAVNVFGVLKEQADRNVKLYSRTDHHWMPSGAYYAAQKFASDAGVPFNSDNYKVVTKSGYVGSMYTYSKDGNLKNDPEDFTLYIPNPNPPTRYYDTSFQNPRSGYLIVTPDASNYYCSFLGSDELIAEVDGTAGNGKTLVIFKDSYGNALVPFLSASYDKIYVCDIRYFKLNAVKFCEDTGATDLLFAFYTGTPAGTNGKDVEKILNQ